MDGTEIWSVEEADGYGGEIRRGEGGSNWDSCAAWGVSRQITHLTPTPPPLSLPSPKNKKKSAREADAGH